MPFPHQALINCLVPMCNVNSSSKHLVHSLVTNRWADVSTVGQLENVMSPSACLAWQRHNYLYMIGVYTGKYLLINLLSLVVYSSH